MPSAPATPTTRNIVPAAALLVLGAAFAATGCGSAAGGAKAADAPVVMSDADSALAELERAEREITSMFGPSGAPGAEPKPAPEPAATAEPAAPTYAQPPPVQQQSPSEDPGVGRKSAGDSAQSDPCAVACLALASMERAANHLCGLSGDDHPRCTNARERVKNKNALVTSRCACSR